MRHETRKEIRDAIATIFIWLVAAMLTVGALLLACLSGGCSAKNLPLTERHETVSVNTETVTDNDKLREMLQMLIEGTFRSDSVYWFIRERIVLNEKGDTVRHDTESHRNHDSHSDHGIMGVMATRDSSGTSHSASVASIKENDTTIPIPVEQQLSWWEKTRMQLGDVLIGIAIAALSVIVIWLVRAWKK